MQEDLADVLNEIECPDLGIGIVDMGLVYVAEWNAKGIEVAFTTTSPSCPFGDALLRQINDILRHRFREAASIHVQLVLDPPWTLERLTDNARNKLGWTGAGTATAPLAHFWSGFASRSWKN
ncbi:MAG: metal-sulfur cluster assembly factor [Xanthobacteraceae bacterium]|jgi:metal-sulfur cluster biosynthetic enzyme